MYFPSPGLSFSRATSPEILDSYSLSALEKRLGAIRRAFFFFLRCSARRQDRIAFNHDFLSISLPVVEGSPDKVFSFQRHADHFFLVPGMPNEGKLKGSPLENWPKGVLFIWMRPGLTSG